MRHLSLSLAALLISGFAAAQEPKPAPAPAASPAAAAAPAPAAAQTPAAAPVSAVAPSPAATPAPVAATQEFARIICFREKKFAGALLHFTIHMDGKDVADLNNGTYFVIKATPGEHSFYADEEKDVFKMKLEAGKTYYFGSKVVMGFWKGNGRLVALEESVGAKTFTDLKAKLAYSPELRDPAVLEVPGATPAPVAAAVPAPAATAPAATAGTPAPAAAPVVAPVVPPAVAPVAPSATPASAPVAAPAAK